MALDIVVAAVGRAKAGPERDLFADYVRRLKWPVTVREVEERRPLPVRERMAREADLLLAALPPAAAVVALDGRGRTLSSPALAEWLATQRDAGVPSIAFVIGGADGLEQAVLDRARLVLSLGAMTWPHMLVRAMLAEQLFRAHSILTGHPYHRG